MQVVEFYDSEEHPVAELTRTPQALGLQPRDVAVFAPRKAGMQAQRATIAPRCDMILFRSEMARAIIYKDKAVLFHNRHVLYDCLRLTDTWTHAAHVVCGSGKKQTHSQGCMFT